MADWQPSANIETLKKRAELFRKIRRFFDSREIYEVDVPLLGARGVTDLHIDCIEARCKGDIHYLQSSPEYFMKRLLAAGSGDIYFLGKAFRDGEAGRRHNPEFTMLEWYRVGWDEHRLMDEVVELIRFLAGDEIAITKLDYRNAFHAALGVDPHTAELPELQRLAAETAGSESFYEDRSTCLDLIFSLKVEPKLPAGLTLIYGYPQCQAALAKIESDAQGQLVARRFEAFLNGVELANGYFELTTADDQAQRFEKDREQRRESCKRDMQADEKLLAALRAGFPNCAGVALGVDRLLMQLLNTDSIESVNAFPFSRL
ncbi:EF-P lysine aminoacylase EpmA [Porticoccaceae bacterium LTM1]|nr:EF-P lysine aminoacylase EpmA [Porticoccaceae bacterium LTM1]